MSDRGRNGGNWSGGRRGGDRNDGYSSNLPKDRSQNSVNRSSGKNSNKSGKEGDRKSDLGSNRSSSNNKHSLSKEKSKKDTDNKPKKPREPKPGDGYQGKDDDQSSNRHGPTINNGNPYSSSSSDHMSPSRTNDSWKGRNDREEWHEAEGQHADSDWTGDINDWLAENEHERNQIDNPTVSIDHDGSVFFDKVWHAISPNHRQYDVELDYSWIDWAVEDTDFWQWFWLWYASFEETWTFDHEPGFVLTDDSYAWEWFQKHTRGHNATMDAIVIDRDDSEQWNWDRWDSFWRDYDTQDLSQTDYYFTDHGNVEVKIAPGEDRMCSDGSYLNEANTCLPCPIGCTHCHALGHCYACQDNFEGVGGPDFGYCFPKCFHGQYRMKAYEPRDDFLLAVVANSEIRDKIKGADMDVVFPPHMMMETCETCDNNCRGCLLLPDESQFCYECLHGYLFDKESDTCVEDPNWDKTETIVKVRASKRTIDQCESVKVRIDPQEGHKSGKALEDVRWTAEIEGLQRGSDAHYLLSKVLKEAQGEQALTLTGQLTSLLEVGTQIKIIGFAAGNFDETVFDHEVIKIERPPTYKITNLDKAYYILAQTGLHLDIKKSQSLCPSYSSGAAEVPLTPEDLERLSCSLSRVNREVIAQDIPCDVGPELLAPGETYMLDLNWRSNLPEHPDEHHLIRIRTQTGKTWCSFPDFDFLYAHPSQEILLEPYIQESDPDYVYRHHWTCFEINPITLAEKPCSTKSPSDKETTWTIPSYFLEPNKLYDFYMHQYALDYRDGHELLQGTGAYRCQTRISTLSDKPSLVLASLTSTAPPTGYMDPSREYSFSCKAAGATSFLLSFSKITPQGDQVVAPDDQVVYTERSLTVLPTFLEANFEYLVDCVPLGAAAEPIGYVSKRYDTFEFAEPIGMSVEPQRGVGLLTDFSMDVFKPPGEALKCQPGYLTAQGVQVLIEDPSPAGKMYSTQVQRIVTKLPAPSGEEEGLTVIAKCTNVDQVTKIVSTRIQVAAPTQADLEKQIEIMTSRTEVGAVQTKVSDVVLLSQALQELKSQSVVDANTYESITDTFLTKLQSLPSLSTSDEIQLSESLLQLTQMVTSDQSLEANAQIYANILQASQLLLNPTEAASSQSQLSYTTYENVVFSVSALLAGDQSAEIDLGQQRLLYSTCMAIYESGLNRVLVTHQHEGVPQFKLMTEDIQIAQALVGPLEATFAADLETRQGVFSVEIPVSELRDGGSETRLLPVISVFNSDGVGEAVGEEQEEAVASSRLVSDIINVSIRVADGEEISDKEVAGLMQPVVLKIPITREMQRLSSVFCMYMDTETSVWTKLGEQEDCPLEEPGYVYCCSPHLTTFSVQEIEAIDIASQLHSMIDGIMEKQEIETGSLFWLLVGILATSTVMLGTGCLLDTKKIMIAGQTQIEEQSTVGAESSQQELFSVGNREPQDLDQRSQVAIELRSSVSSLVSNSKMVDYLPQIKVIEESPGEPLAASGGNPAKIQPEIHLSTIVLELDGSESESTPEISSTRPENFAPAPAPAETPTPTPQTGLKVKDNETNDESAEHVVTSLSEKPSFPSLLLKSFLFYSRVLPMMITYEHCAQSRFSKALSFASQIALVSAYVSYVLTLPPDQALLDSSTLRVFLLAAGCRAISLLMDLISRQCPGKHMSRLQATCLAVIFANCLAYTYVMSQVASREAQTRIIAELGFVLSIDFVILEAVYLLGLSLLAHFSAKARQRLPGLAVNLPCLSSANQ